MSRPWGALADVLVAYDRVSTLSESAEAGRVLNLGRSLPVEGGLTPFFDGWAARPRLIAELLLAVAAVARSRYFRPFSQRLLDPILTSGDGGLRLESFSSCCGVDARADLLPGALRDVTSSVGTTNVDFNAEVRNGLARVDDGEEIRLEIGTAGLLVTTRATAAFERKVRLPTRWIKGLGEAALAQVGMRPTLSVGPAAARRMLLSLPPEGPASARPYTVVGQGRDVALTQRPSVDAPAVAGPFRLRELRPLASFATGLTIWARPGGGARPTAWELDLPDARLAGAQRRRGPRFLRRRRVVVVARGCGGMRAGIGAEGATVVVRVAGFGRHGRGSGAGSADGGSGRRGSGR
jgi:hypothetical protein